jgi:hypothetical protein
VRKLSNGSKLQIFEVVDLDLHRRFPEEEIENEKLGLGF